MAEWKPSPLPQADQPRSGLSDEELMLILQGGLKGRFAREFCVVQGAADALQRYLSLHADPGVQNEAFPLLKAIDLHLKRLERLADNTADLALGATLRSPSNRRPIEMVAYLRTLARTANQELARIRVPARVRFDEGGVETLFAQSNEGVMNALFANLFSNAVQARNDAEITLACNGERRIVCRDNGPGLPAELRALLRAGDTPQLLRRGGTGLLLASAYADDLGWQLLPQDTEEGFTLHIQLPPCDARPAISLRSPEAEAESRAWRQAACLRREFTAVLEHL